MTELFRPDGHLSDEGLQALVDGRLDEMARLEAAEHLGFCTPCMQRYIGFLTGEVLQAPPQDLVLPVARGVRQKQLRLGAKRYAAAAAAVALAITLWGAGVFHRLVPERTDALLPQPTPQAQQNEPQQGGALSGALGAVFGTVGDVCSDFIQRLRPAEGAQPAATPAPTAEPQQEPQATPQPQPGAQPQKPEDYRPAPTWQPLDQRAPNATRGE